MPRTFALLVLLLCGLGSARADEEADRRARPLTPEQAADRILAAVQAEDLDALKALAAKDAPDPWVVANELCGRGRHGAAAAFAKAAPRSAVAALPDYVAALESAPLPAELVAHAERMSALLLAGKWEAALAAPTAGPRTGSSVPHVRIAYGRGVALSRLKRWAESHAAFMKAAADARSLGWLTRAHDAFHQAGTSAYRSADGSAALAAFEARLETSKALKNELLVLDARLDLGALLLDLRRYADALVYLRAGLVQAQARRDRARTARALNNIGDLHSRSREFTRALDAYQRSVVATEALGDKRALSVALDNLGNVYSRLGRYHEARQALRRAADLAIETDDRSGAAISLTNLGVVLRRLGEYEEALAAYRAALAIRTARGDRRGMGSTLNKLGVALRHLGRYPEALEAYRKALLIAEERGDAPAQRRTLTNLGVVHGRMGAYERALDFHRRALKLAATLRDREALAATHTNMGVIHVRRGDLAEGLAAHRRALAAYEALEDRQGVCDAWNNIGSALARMKRPQEALPAYERSLALAAALGDRAGEAATWNNIGSAHLSLNAFDQAAAAYVKARAILETTRPATTLIKVLWGQAQLAAARNDWKTARLQALEAASEAVNLVEGLALGEGASARELWTGLLDIGARAAIRLNDVEALALFLEYARAGSLRETLGQQNALRSTLLPADLRQQVAQAREVEQAAYREYRKARKDGRFARIRAARLELAKAGQMTARVVDDARRQAKQGASIVLPKPAGLADLRASVRAGEALVLYSLAGIEAVALVVEPEAALAVSLGPTKDVKTAIDALLLEAHPHLDPSKAAVLRDLVVKPLALAAGVKRVIVSPTGRLGYVPFALLLPEREVCYAASGTVHRLLQQGARPRGNGVLGFGDPAYAAASGLSPLPATREEVQTVADVAIIGPQATVAAVGSAVKARPRWRALHFACHGLIDPERPLQCALALTPGDADDGFLTVRDVLDLALPADLAVLSACETARGKTYDADGIVGLTRAFMVSGAASVLCSLWKVDDEATQALMIKFYELWRGNGSAGIDAATALRRAQAYVRSHEKWKHPTFWAAWVLWGLPN